MIAPARSGCGFSLRGIPALLDDRFVAPAAAPVVKQRDKGASQNGDTEGVKVRLRITVGIEVASCEPGKQVGQRDTQKDVGDDRNPHGPHTVPRHRA